MSEDKKGLRHPREVPNSFLDLQLMTTNTLWGTDYVSPELRKHLTKSFYMFDEEGKPLKDEKGEYILNKKHIWSLFGIYTRDLRLSNLSYKAGEIQYCQHYLDLAGDILNFGFQEAFGASMRRVATITELAQSKGGFTRRQMGTIRQESSQEFLEPEKKNFFGGGGKK